MKKILHISRTMGQGGAEKVVYQLCKDIDKMEKIVASTGGIYEDELKKYGVKHYYIPDIDSKNPILMIKTFFKLKRIIKKENIEIVHSHHRMAAFYSKVLNMFNKKFKRVYTAHNIFYNKKLLLKYALKDSVVIACGEGVKKNLVDFYGIKDTKIDVICNSIEKKDIINKPSDSFLENKENKVFVGTVGRLSEQKGIDVFISAMAKLINKDSNIYAVVIGDGKLKSQLKVMVDKLNVKKNVLFLGYRSDVIELISQMDFIVLASRWEGFPLTPIETFSVGKTIIVTDIDGNNEIVKNEYNGLLFEKDNVDELCKKIECLIYDTGKRMSFEKNAIKTYDEYFSYSIFIAKYIKIYQSV
ncbi:MAG: glycosyltransferase family 4 protein [Clostridia bacterium]|nr:glycosyltransferase family 4 protein [Clostridia bacterium]